MPRTRKVPLAGNEKENFEFAQPKSKKPAAKKQKKDPEFMQGDGAEVIKLILSIQKTDCNNGKVSTELTKLYKKMGHEPFMASFLRVMQLFIIREESDLSAPRVLKFIGSFVASFGEEVAKDGGSHPIIHHVFNEILSTSSQQYHIRARICTLVMNIMNSFSQNAEVDETIMDKIVERMIGTFIKDISPVVRQNAIMALQRLQDPDNPEDQVTKAYIFHMETDPVARVRQAAITAIAKKAPILPYVLDRLRDNDEKVRRHTYLQMASYQIKAYKIADRIKIIKAGLYDRSEMVKKTVLNLVLPNWISSYDSNYTQFVKAFKLDSTETNILNFRSLTQDIMAALFKKHKISDLIAFLNIPADGEFPNCISIEKARCLEWLIVWKMALKLHQEHIAGKAINEEEQGNESDASDDNPTNETVSNILFMPELSVFCDFVEKFLFEFKISNEVEEKHEKLTFNHCVILLLEIAQLNDFGDLIGCKRLEALCKQILLRHDMSEHGVHEVAKVMEILVQDCSARLTFFNEIVAESVNLGTPTEYSRQTIIEQLIGKVNIDTKLKANGLKMEMMELKEAEANFVAVKKYGDAQAVAEKFAALEAELIELLRPFAEESDTASQSLVDTLSSCSVAKKATPSEILKNLRICFFAVMTKGVKSLTPEMIRIYKNFICYYLESTDVITRIWALKSATAYALLYEPLSNDVYMLLKSQLFKSNNTFIWECAIGCIVDLLLRYSIEKLEVRNEEMSANMSQSRSKKGGRSLYTYDVEETDESDILASIDVIQMLTKVLDSTAQDIRVHRTVLIGICKLILHGQYCTKEIIGKFLLAYFNPATESEINQTLGVFFESVIRMRKQEFLHDALIPTMKILLEAPGDSPLREVKMETVIKYVIEATRPVFCSNGLNLHNTLALKLFEMMKENPENKEIQKIVSKELMKFEIGDDSLLKKDLVALIETLLKESTADVKTKKSIGDFRDVLLGVYKAPLKFSSTTATLVTVDEDAGEPEDGEVEEESQDNEKQSSSDRILASELIDVSVSGIEIQTAVVNVQKLKSTEYSFDESERLIVLESPPKQIAESQPIGSEDINIPETQPDVEIPETQEQEVEESSEDEKNETVIESVAAHDSSDDDVEIPETPEPSQELIEPPKRSTRKSITSKRHLELSSSSFNSPLCKNPRNGASPKPVTPKAKKVQQEPRTPTTPKTPRSGNTSTPNIERLTRRQAKESLAQSVTLTRSASRSLNVDAVEIAAKVAKSPPKTKTPERPKTKPAAKPSQIPKQTKTSAIRAAKASSTVPPAPERSTTRAAAATVSRVTRKNAAADAPRPRWN